MPAFFIVKGFESQGRPSTDYAALKLPGLLICNVSD